MRKNRLTGHKRGATVKAFFLATALAALLGAAPASAAISFATKWGSLGSGDGQFGNPRGVATDASGNVYVADTNNDRIQKFDSTGAFIGKWGSRGVRGGEFVGPFGVATDPSGNVYVTDRLNNRIQKFDSTGAFIAVWGSSGSGDGQFFSPAGVATDAAGNVYVADSDNDRIQKFDSTGTFIGKWGSTGSTDGQFDGPFGIATDPSGNVYVADTFNNRIQKFDSTGTFIAKWGSNGSGDGEFFFPRGVATDTSGNVYVADTDNNRIQKFRVVAPAAPTLSSTAPASPANDNNPRILGSAAADTTVRLYTSANCSGTPAATGTASELASPGLAVSVPDDSTTTFRATATDSTADTSACSAGIAYVEGSTAPPTPVPPDDDAPDFALDGKRTQRFGKPIVVRANCANEPCKVAATGAAGMAEARSARGLAAGTAIKLRKAVTNLATAQTAKLELKLRTRGADGEVLRRYRKLRRAVGRGETARATIDATAADGFGNRSSDELTVKLKG